MSAVMSEATMERADLLDWLRGRQWLVQNGFIPKAHAILSDPPYFLGSISKRFGNANAATARYGTDGLYQRASRGFMGKTWDGFESVWHYQAWVTEWASMLLDFVYPGAIGMFFGGSRTYHRLAAGLEDAGWEVTDAVVYLFGSGFPKSHNIGKAIDKAAGVEREVVGEKPNKGRATPIHGGGLNTALPFDMLTAPATAEAAAWEGYGTALKPAYEMVVICRAPRGNYTYAELAQQFGTGAFNIDGGRIPTDERVTCIQGGKASHGFDVGSSDATRHTEYEMPAAGRWPANLILDAEAGRLLDAMSGELTSGGSRKVGGDKTPNGIYGSFASNIAFESFGDTGGASRFFYTAKAGGFERQIPSLVSLRSDLSPQTKAFVQRRLDELKIQPAVRSSKVEAEDHA